MALEKIEVVDKIEVVENGSVQVRTATKIMEDGVQISGTFHRHVVVPGDSYSQEDARVQAICAAVHTTEVIAAYQASQQV
jgi:archaellum component FlaF (FlaF/FlaG flagellin family)